MTQNDVAPLIPSHAPVRLFKMIHSFSTKGGVDLPVRGGFLAYLTPSMCLLDRIYSMSEGEMQQPFCQSFKEKFSQALWFTPTSGRRTGEYKLYWVLTIKRWITRPILLIQSTVSIPSTQKVTGLQQKRNSRKWKATQIQTSYKNILKNSSGDDGMASLTQMAVLDGWCRTPQNSIRCKYKWLCVD